jgi:PAS domain S-box-containing protein
MSIVAKYPILDELKIPENLLENWQITTDLLAEIAKVPAALIMRVHAREIEVLVASHTHDNVYHSGEKAPLDTGLYCETVMNTRKNLLVPNALKDPDWDHNPDLKLGMISYCGLPLTWPGGDLFGTFCILDDKETSFNSQVQLVMERLRDSIQLSLVNLYEMNLTFIEQNKVQNTWRESESRILHDLETTNIRLRAEMAERKRAEDKVYFAFLYARSLIETSLDPLVTISADGKITDVNEATVLVTGVPREQLIGSDFSGYFTDSDKARNGYREVFEKGFVKDYLLTIRHKNGRLTDVLYNASVYHDEQGNVGGICSGARHHRAPPGRAGNTQTQHRAGTEHKGAHCAARSYQQGTGSLCLFRLARSTCAVADHRRFLARTARRLR